MEKKKKANEGGSEERKSEGESSRACARTGKSVSILALSSIDRWKFDRFIMREIWFSNYGALQSLKEAKKGIQGESREEMNERGEKKNLFQL